MAPPVRKGDRLASVACGDLLELFLKGIMTHVEEHDEYADRRDTSAITKGTRDREAWWAWRWDRTDAEFVEIPFTIITRWRRGSFLTVYRMETPGDVKYWFYFPFNVGVGFSVPVRVKS